jgi:hypothetical protein
MKQYTLTKETIFEIPCKKVHYSFTVSPIQNNTEITHIIIHQTGNANTIQKVINNHVKKRHFSSIGYHILIGKNGQIYLSRELNKVGAHCYGYNQNAIGIALFGNFDKNEPTEKQLTTLKNLIEKIKIKYNNPTVLGHNQAIYNLVKKRCKNLPEKNLLDIQTDIEYYSFLKKIHDLINEKDEECKDTFNKIKSCPGIHMYPHLKNLVR